MKTYNYNLCQMSRKVLHLLYIYIFTVEQINNLDIQNHIVHCQNHK